VTCQECEIYKLPFTTKIELLKIILERPVSLPQYEVWFGNVYDVFLETKQIEFPTLLEALKYVEQDMPKDFGKGDYKDFTTHPRLAIWVFDSNKKEVHLYQQKKWTIYNLDQWREHRNVKQ
jgi:hypothetical protein